MCMHTCNIGTRRYQSPVVVIRYQSVLVLCAVIQLLLTKVMVTVTNTIFKNNSQCLYHQKKKDIEMKN